MRGLLFSLLCQQALKRQGRPSGLIGQYKPYLNSNDSPTRDILKDYSGQGHDIQLYNFGYALQSGYGSYGLIPSSITPNSLSYGTVESISYSKVRFTAKTNFGVGSLPTYYNTKAKNRKFKLKITYSENSNFKIGIYLMFTDDRETQIYEFGSNNIVDIDIPESDFNLVKSTSPGTKVIEGSMQVGDWFELEVLSDYPGALVSDGIDDYGLCKDFPQLTLEKGYTVCAIRKKITESSIGVLVSTRNNNIEGVGSAAFVMDKYTSSGAACYSYSFGFATNVNIVDDDFVYQTKNSYCGQAIQVGGLVLENPLLLFAGYYYPYLNGKVTEFGSFALYALEIYDHDLTDEEIESVKEAMYNEYLTATNALQNHIIADYECYDKTNEDEDRDVLKDLSGNGHDIQLYNFGFAEGSGYGLYGAPRLGSWTYSSAVGTATLGNDSFTLLSTSGNSSYSIIFYNQDKPWHFKFKITGLTEGDLRLYARTGDKAGSVGAIYTEDGIYEFSDDSNSSWGFTTSTARESCNITVEQLPLEYQGALVSDGVDDYGLCENFPILNTTDGYTILAIRKNFRTIEGVNQCFISNRDSDTQNGAFNFELGQTTFVDELRCDSFAIINKVNKSVYPDLFTFSTSRNYNNTSINIGEGDGTNVLNLFRLNNSASSSFNFNGALYALKILDKDCTTEEIKFIAKQMVAKHKEKTGETIELNF